jgi:hypothetical protein
MFKMVTAQQLQTASNVATQLQDLLEQLRQTIQFAVDAKVAGIPLDSATITALQTQYSALKSQLVTVFGQLP